MADPLDLDILKRLTVHLKGITPANGYDVDLSQAVFRGRLLFGENDPLPMLSILESPNPSLGIYAGENFNAEFHQWTIFIQGFADNDADNPTDPAYLLKGQVERHLARITAERPSGFGGGLYTGEYMLGGTIADMKVLPGTVRPPQEGVSSKAFFYLPVQLKVVRNPA